MIPKVYSISYLFAEKSIFVCFRAQMDDPLDAIAVHGGGGIIGVLAVPIFGYNSGKYKICWNTSSV